jgi:hypothetical protein
MVTFVSKSLDDAVTQVRLTINDVGVNGANFRYTNAQIVAQFNTAIRELYRYRPDAFIGNFTQGVLVNNNPLPTYSDAIDLGLNPATVLPFDDRMFFNAVVFFIVGMLELGDDEFTDQSRSAQLLSSFRQMLIGPGG